MRVVPEPRLHGDYARGMAMLSGQILLEGEVIEMRAGIPFTARTGAAERALHGFGWLDDLAAVGDTGARHLAQAALQSWIAQFGRGAGRGWSPELVGRRVLRWLGHSLFLMQDMDAQARNRLLSSLSVQAAYLDRRATRAPSGPGQIEAQVGLFFAALTLQGLSNRIGPVTGDLVSAARGFLTEEGCVDTRNPEDLLQVFEQLARAAQALADDSRPVPKGLLDLLDKGATTLRHLCHTDGTLARFHGGGAGRVGVLSAAFATHARLCAPGITPRSGLAMGFARLAAGRCSVIIDAAPPPRQAAAVCAHASTLAFELTSNRRPVIVSCGDGRTFGAEWSRASRATALHSTLALEGYSSSRLASRKGARVALADGPRQVRVEFRHAPYARAVLLSHDGYAAGQGLEHLRYLDLSSDGRVLTGEDSLVATTRTEQRRFEEVLERSRQGGISFSLHFHLHPDAEATLEDDCVAITLASGEVWLFAAPGQAVSLAPSVYLEKGLPNPRRTQQIVLSSQATDYTTQINWSLAKAPQTPVAVRDLLEDTLLAVPRP